MRHSHPRQRLWRLSIVLSVLLLAGCARHRQSTLHASGAGAQRIEGLWWLLFWISMAVFAEVMLILGWALWRRRRATATIKGGDAIGAITVLGVAVPFVILVAAYGLGLRDLNALAAPREKPDVTVEVIGHQWWWEIHYPDRAGAVTANEMHIPVGQPVKVRLRTADVQHSFWVPQLMPKTDLIAGKVNETWLQTDRAGTYRAQCAEYCGKQHAFMALMVVAEPRPAFDAWVAATAQPATGTLTTAQQRGRQIFEQSSCASCHTIRGTSAVGEVGPDLTTIGSRWSIGAGAAPNDAGHLGGWIVNSQTIKPGNAMPPQPVAAQDLPDLLSYLQSLK
ncbi:cytochrome c oxidase subunit II [Pseudosporangium ferrugineum]|uniref:cytochrome-c oxidase n=1 Tax=Pseudosporangium ferrugineum TaxID=439699 RepID=A0A2T0RG94_9ACTN|nr:cytochrome c oxidase subunit II [Pseudosporangium ferrugineum]PRY20185.1 cytochrome c oxidase subunit 2 [Pseudosporangium ferrugineum]